MNLKKMSAVVAIAMLASVGFSQNKIGVVDADMVIQNSAKGKVFFEAYQALVKTRQDEIAAMIENYRSQEKDAQAKAASMSEEKKSEVAAQLQRSQTEIKRKQEDAEREMKLKLDEKLEEFRKQLGPLIRQIAIDMTLDMVLNVGPNSDLVYFSEQIDITPAVIQKFDAL